jgi:hypothetical protein
MEPVELNVAKRAIVSKMVKCMSNCSKIKKNKENTAMWECFQNTIEIS